MSVQCASKKTEPQELVIAEDKVHGLFVILHLDRRANRLQCVRALENLKTTCTGIFYDRISLRLRICCGNTSSRLLCVARYLADIRDDDNEIIMAIGFGPALLKEVYPDASKRGVESFDYKARNFRGGSMPATGKFNLGSRFCLFLSHPQPFVSLCFIWHSLK
ncbi:unnamed protein product [Schistocephalus solidus]|uniref:FIST_C domain-containing protein n=1 Tax=Schistocephalus solidus TaxID=70667 RepID=A0A183THX0_SCHSO|nr:unnamed protein product [Schistocephalus solidus]